MFTNAYTTAVKAYAVAIAVLQPPEEERKRTQNNSPFPRTSPHPPPPHPPTLPGKKRPLPIVLAGGRGPINQKHGKVCPPNHEVSDFGVEDSGRSTNNVRSGCPSRPGICLLSLRYALAMQRMGIGEAQMTPISCRTNSSERTMTWPRRRKRR